MSIPNINSVISQMQTMATQASSIQKNIGDNSISEDTGFTTELAKGIKKINELQNDTTNISEGFTLGREGIGINDVMVSMQKSSVALNFGVQVRNKLISAYQSIMAMNV